MFNQPSSNRTSHFGKRSWVFAPFISVFAIFVLALSVSAWDGPKKCGTNDKCRIVDVMDRNIFGADMPSSWSVGEAWNQLRPSQCSDVYNVVVGGTMGEDGAPSKSVPAGFAEHIGDNRCTIVVRYTLEAPGVIDALAYNDSVEHGRKALAIVLNKLDQLRTQAGMGGKIRVWGHSKGAAIVESIWTQEARNNGTKFIKTGMSIDPCPSNRCFYFGFGYPFRQESDSSFALSRNTASLWSMDTRGFISKPGPDVNQWHRLTTFSNESDPIYTCSLQCAAVIFDPCHRYEQFLRIRQWNLDIWNVTNETDLWKEPSFTGDRCGA